MTFTLYNVTFVLGLALIVLGLIGGGLEVKEIKVPTLPAFPRVSSALVGSVLLYLCIAHPGIFETQTSPPTLDPPGKVGKQQSPEKSAPQSAQPAPQSTKTAPQTIKPAPQLTKIRFPSQPLLLAYARDQRPLADDLKTYLVAKGYEVNAHLDDFSGIKLEAREKPGTIRVVYKQVAKDAEFDLVGVMRNKFSSNMPRLVESSNDNASVDLQVQLW